jgi:molecular chaperone HtpG
MTAEEIKKYINQIAFSGATEFVEKFKEAKDANEIIGRFGLGFYSAFMVADKVEIETLATRKALNLPAGPAMAAPNLRLAKAAWPNAVPKLPCILMPKAKSFWISRNCRESLINTAKFLPVPIKFGTTTQEEEDGVDEEGKPKYKSVETDNIINDTTPIWTKSPTN